MEREPVCLWRAVAVQATLEVRHVLPATELHHLQSGACERPGLDAQLVFPKKEMSRQ